MAATLTTPQKTLIRLDMGDACLTTDDATLQLAYDEAEGNDCQTRVILYRWKIALLKPEKLRLVDGREVFSNATIKAYESRQAEWEACAGAANGVSIGSSSTYTFRADSLQTEEPDYSTDAEV